MRLLRVLPDTFDVMISIRPLRYHWYRTAVIIRSLSKGSRFPPGKAVCPGCVLRCFDLVVSRTRSSLSCSYRSTRTAASFDCGWKKLPHKNIALITRSKLIKWANDGRIWWLQGREIVNQVIDASSGFLSENIKDFFRYRTYAGVASHGEVRRNGV